MNQTGRLLCALAMAFCFSGAQAGVEMGSTSDSHEMKAPVRAAADQTRTTPLEWPIGLLPAVAEELGREAPWRPEATPQGAQATNTRHGLQARFDAQGLHLETDAGAVRLALAGFGRDGELAAPGAAEAEVDGARVLYRHGPHLTQWFLNSPLGLEQGFTLERRPEGSGELRFALALGGDLQARLEQNELVFEDETGAAQLRYGALVAYDAQGQALPARMHLANARLVLAVDDADATYPVVVDPLFAQVNKITAADSARDNWFGFSVVWSGDTILVGAPGVLRDGTRYVGAAYVFTRNGATWTQQAKLTADDGASGDEFGSSVALDGDTALVGAYGVRRDGTRYVGAAYVFTRNGGTWAQRAKLTADDGASGDYFGLSVALSGDTALVGAPYARVGGLSKAGAAYVFTRSGATATWSQQAKLTADDDARGGNYFGYSVALSGGAAALVGAPFAGLDQPGAAYVFTRDDATWTRQVTLTADDGAQFDQFGASVALSGDTALIGAPGLHYSYEVSIVGAAYVFTRSGAAWTQQAKLTASDGAQGNDFGRSVALSGDAALVGAPYSDLDGKSRVGAAYVFARNGATWSQQAKLTADDGVQKESAYFGRSAALSGDTALVGAYRADFDSQVQAGAAYLFGPAVDLQLVKRATLGEAPQGGVFGYSLYVTNLDLEVDATGVTVTDPLPPGVSYVADDGGCARSGATLTCALGPLAKGGGMAGVHVTVRADAAPGALIINTASASADQPDANPADNADSVTTTISNTAPVASDSVLLAYEGATVAGMLSAADAGGDALTFSIVSPAAKGAVEITDASTGAYTYTAAAGQSGVDAFTFKANDGALDSNIATVTVTLHPLPAPGNVAPVASNLSLAAYEGGAISGALPASDANGDALTFSIVANGAKGAAVVTDAAAGAFTYTPNPGETGTDTFTFKANDGALDSNIATVLVTIQPLPAPGNVAPVASNLSLAAYEGGAISGALPASDANGDALTFSIVANGAKGAAVITDAAAGAFTYTPNPGETGTDTFTFKANDGALDSNIATVTVAIQPANHVEVEGRRGGGSFDLSFLLLGISILAVRHRRRPAIRLLCALSVAVIAVTLYVPAAQAGVEEPDRSRERSTVTASPAGASHEASQAVAADNKNNLSPADWPTGLLPAVAEELGREAPWRPEATPQGAQAANPRHGLAARFDAQGLHLETDAGAVRLALAGFGRDGELAAPGAADAEVDGARVVYRHDANLTQWFINSPLGLEQGFTLEQRPEGRGELRFALALGGDLQARLEQNELVFDDEAGVAQLRYGALVAYDARGRALPARMHLAGARLVLAVDDADATYPVVVDPLFAQVNKITAADSARDNWFGFSVVWSGDTILVGAPGVLRDGTRYVGAAYVFTRNGATWTQQAKLTADDGAYGDEFGSSVALDGDTALVGARYANPGGVNDAGAAYVFTRNGGTWAQRAKLTVDDGASGDNFGLSVALSGDTALVGAPYARVGGLFSAGAAYVFTLDGATATWTQQAKLIADDDNARAGAYFGYSVALSDDGAAALVGAPHAGLDQPGAVYVFTRDDATWTRQVTLTADDGVRFDRFGDSVALSGDTALIGAPGLNLSYEDSIVGAAYVFTRSGATWTQQAKLTANDGELSDEFGASVALSGDTALVGARYANPGGVNDAGAAYVFARNGATWSQQAKLTADDGVQKERAYFGRSAALSGDAALVGAYRVDFDSQIQAGAAYLFGPAVDLQLVKRATLGEAPQGGVFGYSLYVTNLDLEVDATGVTVTDPLPPGVSYVADDGGCARSGATLTCALGPLAKGGGMAGVHVTVRADAAPGALITNTASASADQPDANPADNADSVTTTISNTAPVASDSVLLAYEGATVAGMLSAADAGGDALTFSIVSPAAKGVVEIADASTGAYTYTAAAGQSGVDAFTFKANDGIDDSNVATVSVVIQPANRAPVASNVAITTYQGAAVTGVLPASDANGDALTFSIVANGAKGAAVVTDAATGAFTYTPNAGETGTDSFTFKANDGALDSNIATVSVTIQPLPAPGNVAPVASNLSLVAYEGGVISGVLAASDANGDALTFSIVANGAKGAAVVTDAATGAFTYTPNAGETGTDSFTFKANDGALDSNIATVTVAIQPANHVEVEGRRGGGGSFDLSLLLMGASLLAVRNLRPRLSRRTHL